MIKAGQKDPKWTKVAKFALTRAPEELYDLNKDPLCMNNLVDSPEYKNKVKAFREKVLDRMKSTQDYLYPIYKDYIAHGDVVATHASLDKIIEERNMVGRAPKNEHSLEFFYKIKKQRKRKNTPAK